MLTQMTVVVGAVVVLAAVAIAAVLVFGRRGRAQPSAPQPQQSRQALVQQAQSSLAQAADAERCRPYAALFDRLAPPLQKLLGLAALPPQSQPWATPAACKDLFDDAVAREIGYALSACKAQVRGGKLVLPLPTPAPQPALQDWSEDRLRTAIDDSRRTIEGCQVLVQQQNVCQALTPALQAAADLAQKSVYDVDAVRALAGQVQAALEQNGIYPLFFDDPRLQGETGLRARFARVSALQLVYPGLYLQQDGRWEQFGIHTGTCKEDNA